MIVYRFVHEKFCNGYLQLTAMIDISFMGPAARDLPVIERSRSISTRAELALAAVYLASTGNKNFNSSSSQESSNSVPL